MRSLNQPATKRQDGSDSEVTRLFGLVGGDLDRNDSVSHNPMHGLNQWSSQASLQCLIASLKGKDAYTWEHSQRVSSYATVIARQMELSSTAISEIGLGGELHDIGKLTIPGYLLRKAGPLSRSEYRAVSAHAENGARMLSRFFPAQATVVRVARSHHERMDGRGGPDGLSGTEIPLAARIVSVADSYDAMTSSRAYRVRMPQTVAIRELEVNSESQFDVDCVAALERAIHVPTGFVVSSRLAA